MSKKKCPFCGSENIWNSFDVVRTNPLDVDYGCFDCNNEWNPSKGITTGELLMTMTENDSITLMLNDIKVAKQNEVDPDEIRQMTKELNSLITIEHQEIYGYKYRGQIGEPEPSGLTTDAQVNLERWPVPDPKDPTEAFHNRYVHPISKEPKSFWVNRLADDDDEPIEDALVLGGGPDLTWPNLDAYLSEMHTTPSIALIPFPLWLEYSGRLEKWHQIPCVLVHGERELWTFKKPCYTTDNDYAAVIDIHARIPRIDFQRIYWVNVAHGMFHHRFDWYCDMPDLKCPSAASGNVAIFSASIGWNARRIHCVGFQHKPPYDRFIPGFLEIKDIAKANGSTLIKHGPGNWGGGVDE